MTVQQHPLIRYWWLFALGSIGAWAIMMVASGGFPIVELELAWTVERADEVVSGADLDAVRASIYWDFLFLALYTPALYFGSLWARSKFTRGQTVGTLIAAGAFVAGMLDVIENLAMLGYLNDWGGWTGWPTIAAGMAIPKFLLVLIAIIYILIGMALVGRRTAAGR